MTKNLIKISALVVCCMVGVVQGAATTVLEAAPLVAVQLSAKINTTAPIVLSAIRKKFNIPVSLLSDNELNTALKDLDNNTQQNLARALEILTGEYFIESLNVHLLPLSQQNVATQAIQEKIWDAILSDKIIFKDIELRIKKHLLNRLSTDTVANYNLNLETTSLAQLIKLQK